MSVIACLRQSFVKWAIFEIVVIEVAENKEMKSAFGSSGYRASDLQTTHRNGDKSLKVACLERFRAGPEPDLITTSKKRSFGALSTHLLSAHQSMNEQNCPGRRLQKREDLLYVFGRRLLSERCHFSDKCLPDILFRRDDLQIVGH